METPPDLIVHNVTPTTVDFMVVIGAFNAQIVRSFDHPVVGLQNGWYADYKYFYPFSTARRCEFVISRALPTLTATTEIPLSAEMARAAPLSADFATNVRIVAAIAIDKWARPRFRVTNAGVLATAQHRFRVNDPFAREEYRKQFIEFPTSDREIADLCRPPQNPALSAPPVAQRPVANSQFDWDMSSDEAKAAALYAWSDVWLRPTPTAEPIRREPVRIVIPEPEPPADAEWRPTPEQLASLRSDDWKRW